MAARRGPNPLVLVLVAVVVLAIVAVVVSSAGGDDGDDGAASAVAELASVTVDGAALPPHDADASADPAVGEDAPTVSGTDFDGSAVEIGDGPAVLVFVAHWCPHCQAEVPVIGDWLASNELPDGVSLVGVSTAVQASAPNYPPSAWLEREGFDVPVLRDDEAGSAAMAYGLQSFPYFVVVGSDGAVVERTAGEIGIDRFEELLDAAAGA